MYPIVFVRSGQVSIGNGRLGHSGIYGYGWSSRANSSDLRYAYILGFTVSDVYPSGYDNRWNGFPLRCYQ